MQCPEKCRPFCVFVDDIRSHARGHGVAPPIGSIAAESEIFLGESGFPPFLFPYIIDLIKRNGKHIDQEDLMYGMV